MTAKQLSRITMLASLCIALRFAFSPFPNIKPITAIFFLLVPYLSLAHSLIVMVLTMTITGLLMGFGPWVFWQIVSYMVLLVIWWILMTLTPIKRWKNPLWGAVLAGSLAVCFGALMAVADSWQYGTSWLPYWLNGLSFDALHGGSTFFFYPILNHIFRRIFTHEKNNNQP